MLKQTPSLNLVSYFDRSIFASGYVEDRKRAVTRRFEARFIGKSSGDRLSIDESLHYCDGEVEQRDWRIERAGPHLYNVTADFIEGTGKIEVDGMQARWRYHGLVPFRDGKIKLCFDDLMVMTSDSHIVSSISISKFGLVVARCQTFYQPL